MRSTQLGIALFPFYSGGVDVSPTAAREIVRLPQGNQAEVLDESGFDKIERAECPEAAHLLYKIIASRNQKRSTALVTNVDFDKWGEYLSDGPLAMAFLDRLVERAIILKIKGKTYRTPLAKSEDNPA